MVAKIFETLATNSVYLIGASAFITIWAFGAFLRELKADPNVNSVYPSIMSGQGTFFTFVGVAVVLCTFDTSNMGQSIPNMLGGLKLAFITSVIGLGSSLFAKWLASGARKRNQAPGSEVTKDENDLYLLLRSIDRTMDKQCELLQAANAKYEVQNLQLERLSTDWKTDREALTEQLADLKQEVRTSNDIMEQTLTKITRDLMDSNMDILCKNLKTIIKGFNEKLGTQLGDNFVVFNDAMEKVITFQKQHTSTLQMAVATFGELQGIMEANQQEMTKLNTCLTSFQTGMDRMAESTLVFQTTVTANAEKSQRLLSESLGSLQHAISTNAQAMQEQLAQKLQACQEEFRVNVDKLEQTMWQGVQEHQDSLAKSIVGCQEQFAANVSSLQQTITASTLALQAGIKQDFAGTQGVLQEIGSIQTGFAKEFEALNQINQDVLNGNVQLVESMKQLSADLNNILATNSDFTARREQLFADMQRTQDVVARYAQITTEALNGFNAKFEDKLKTIDTRLAESVGGMAEKSVENLNKIVNAFQLAVEKQSAGLNTKLETYINGSLESMAATLHKLNTEYIGDYEKAKEQFLQLQAALNQQKQLVQPEEVN